MTSSKEYCDSFIKGAIGEVIAEEMFKKMGFYVLRLGKEKTLNPLTQLESFIQCCSGKFKLARNIERELIIPVDTINRMPDFVVINRDGIVEFLEVKFRKNGRLSDKDADFFSVYPNARMLMINFNFPQETATFYNLTKQEKEEYEKTRFHILTADVETEEIVILPLRSFLKEEFGLEEDKLKLLSEYEELVSRWFEGK